jgi:cobalt-zinc-cadmium efflux system outer membrane protein
MFVRTCVLSLAVLHAAIPARAQQVLGLDSALQRARDTAPLVLAARARIDEARARLIDAQLRFRENPTIDVAAGPRTGGTNSIDVDLGIEQFFETGGQRRARIAAAEAGIDRESAGADAVVRQHLRNVAIAFLEGLAARERVNVAQAALNVAAELRRVSDRRYEVGDIAALDVNLTRIAAARAQADLQDALAGRAATDGHLRVLLALPPEEPLELDGELSDRRRFDLETLAARAPDRPELRAIAAEIREAEAEGRLGRAQSRPDIGPRLGFEREGSDRLLLFGASLRLPWSNRGQAAVAAAEARSRRLLIELDATRLTAATEVRTAFAIYRAQAEAADAMAALAIPALTDNETLADRSYEVGQIGLLDLLMLRRDALDVRLTYIKHLLEAAVTGVELEAASGVLR